MFLKVNKTFLKTKVFIMEILDQNMRPENKMHKKRRHSSNECRRLPKEPPIKGSFHLSFFKSIFTVIL